MNSFEALLVEAFDSSESSDSESDICDDDTSDTEDEVEVILFLARKTNKLSRRPLRIKPEAYLNNVVSNLNSYEFKNNYRISPSTFEYVLLLIGDSITRQSSGHKTISGKRQLLLTLWVLASGESYKNICERFSTARATAVVSFRKVLTALKQLSPRFIKWPLGPLAAEVAHGYRGVSGLGGVIGALDTTHIPIQQPKVDAEIYVNDAGRHTIQLQVVCDHRRRFTHCYAGHPGSVHKQQVFNSSEVSTFMQDDSNQTYFPSDTYLVADQTYSISNHLIVPYKDSGYLSQKEKAFNRCLKKSHIIVKKALGLLKGRFPRLKNKIPMTRVDVIPCFVIAACVLHNICLIRRDNMHEFDDVTDDCVENSYPAVKGPSSQVAAGTYRRVQLTSSLEII